LNPFHRHFDGLWRLVSQVLEWIPVLAVLALVVLVLAVEVMAAGALVLAGRVARVLLLLRF
jgi:hypothetical protein